MITRPSEVCLNAQRRADVRARGLNGIDYVEVSRDQLTLSVYFLRKAPDQIVKENVQIEGGVRFRQIQVVDLRLCATEEPGQDDCLQVMVDKPGDFSTYTLRLVDLDDRAQPTDRPLVGFDPRYAQVDFSFKAGLHSDLDCKQQAVCAPPEFPATEINYLSKDYGSFRQLILDRLALTMPSWQEQHVPDVGIALVEVLAYVGDYLSYYQDAVATEAYLNTARQRVSVRRHVRLVDYTMNEGCNARSWVVIEAHSDVIDPPLDPASIYFLAGYQGPGPQAGTTLTPGDLEGVAGSQYEVFAPVATAPIKLYEAHNRLRFYTWGSQLCCLAAGATSATLRDEWEQTDSVGSAAQPGIPASAKTEKAVKSVRTQQQVNRNPAARAVAPVSPAPREGKLHLQPGDFLLFEELLGSDGDGNQHVVRLTSVQQSVDPLYDQPVVEIAWAAEDALPFSLCLSKIGPAPDCQVQDISVARGNVVLVDHGSRTAREVLGTVPLLMTPPACQRIGRAADLQVQAGKFQPTLKRIPLTFLQPIPNQEPAARRLMQDPRLAVPQIRLSSIPPMLDGSGPLFLFEDLQNPARLAPRLANPRDPSAHYLRGHFAPRTLTLLGAFDPSAPLGDLGTALQDELSSLVRSWIPQPDLLRSQPQDFHYVVEIDDEGFAHLRFGDGDCGRAPEAGEAFSATYRIGNGTAGNVGAETITQAVVTQGVLSGTMTPRNPMPAQGGRAPESIDEVKLFAPGAFQKRLERAITADDYVTLAERDPRVQRAAAELQWTGTRYEAHIAIDPLGTEQVDPNLLKQIQGHLHPYRRIGHDLVVVPAQYVPLDVAMTVTVLPNYLRAHVGSALLDVFSNRALPGGGRGYFHPDNLSFGDSVYLSKLVSAAQAVTGIASVTITKLERLFAGPNHEIDNGVLPIGPLEVARLDNDPGLPENGKFALNLRGGR